MRIHRFAAGVGVFLACTLTGCASTVTGDGRLAADAPAETEEPTETSESTERTEPTETTAPTDAGEDELDCPEESVSPAGAPYCYTAPAGLDAVQLGDPTAGEAGSFRTSYGFGPADHIEVQAYVVGIDTDDLTDEQIIAELAGVIVSLEAGGYDFDEQPMSLLVDDARGFAYRGTSDDRSQTIVTNFVFRGLNEVQVNCASTERTDAINAACVEVMASLQIVG